MARATALIMAALLVTGCTVSQSNTGRGGPGAGAGTTDAAVVSRLSGLGAGTAARKTGVPGVVEVRYRGPAGEYVSCPDSVGGPITAHIRTTVTGGERIRSFYAMTAGGREPMAVGVVNAGRVTNSGSSGCRITGTWDVRVADRLAGVAGG